VSSLPCEAPDFVYAHLSIHELPSISYVHFNTKHSDINNPQDPFSPPISLPYSHAPSSTSSSHCAKITCRSQSSPCSAHSPISSFSTPFTIPFDQCCDCKLLKTKHGELQDLQYDKVYLIQQNCELGERCKPWSANVMNVQDKMQQPHFIARLS
jgi:hypothetical protein